MMLALYFPGTTQDLRRATARAALQQWDAWVARVVGTDDEETAARDLIARLERLGYVVYLDRLAA